MSPDNQCRVKGAFRSVRDEGEIERQDREREAERSFKMELPEHVCRGEAASGEGKVEDRIERRL